MDFQIEDNVLYKYGGTEEIVCVPPGVRRIRAGAFSENKALQEVYLPEGVESIGEEAFKKCEKLRKAVLPDSLEYIGDWAFAYCSKLKEVSWGSHLEEIGDGAFFACFALREIRLPPTLRKIGGIAFSCCISLREVHIPDGVVSVGEECFYTCYGMRRVAIPASLTSIGPNPFGWCRTQMKLEVSPDNPGYSAQDGNLVSKDGSVLFSCPAAMGSVRIGDGITVLEEKCLTGSFIEQLELPAGLQRIEKEALSRCRELHSLKLPEGLRWIGEHAFASSGLTELVIPERVEHIDDGILNGCKVRHVSILGSKVEIGSFCGEKDLQPDAMLTADSLEIKDYPAPFHAIHGLRSYAARWAAGEEMPETVHKRFRGYLKRNYLKHWEEPQIFALITALQVLPVSAMDAAIQRAAEMQNPTITAALLQYQHERFSQEQMEEQWRKQVRQEERSHS